MGEELFPLTLFCCRSIAVFSLWLYVSYTAHHCSSQFTLVLHSLKLLEDLPKLTQTRKESLCVCVHHKLHFELWGPQFRTFTNLWWLSFKNNNNNCPCGLNETFFPWAFISHHCLNYISYVRVERAPHRFLLSSLHCYEGRSSSCIWAAAQQCRSWSNFWQVRTEREERKIGVSC